MLNWDLTVPLLAKQNQRTIVMRVIDWSLIGMKTFYMPFANTQKKRIDIHRKVTLGFKYIYINRRYQHGLEKFVDLLYQVLLIRTKTHKKMSGVQNVFAWYN